MSNLSMYQLAPPAPSVGVVNTQQDMKQVFAGPYVAATQYGVYMPSLIYPVDQRYFKRERGQFTL